MPVIKYNELIDQDNPFNAHHNSNPTDYRCRIPEIGSKANGQHFFKKKLKHAAAFKSYNKSDALYIIYIIPPHLK